jgi:hypothetical protein
VSSHVDGKLGVQLVVQGLIVHLLIRVFVALTLLLPEVLHNALRVHRTFVLFQCCGAPLTICLLDRRAGNLGAFDLLSK